MYFRCNQIRSLLKIAQNQIALCNKVRLCSTKDSFAGLSIEDEQVQKYLRQITTEFYDLQTKSTSADYQRTASLKALVEIFEQRNGVLQNLEILGQEMQAEKDKDLLALMEDEEKSFRLSVSLLSNQLLEAIFSMGSQDSCSSVFLEVTAGVGGQEAMLFASEIHDMYCGYCGYKRWDNESLALDTTELGGIRHSSSIVTGSGVSLLKFEAGVHRVQRIPSTEKSGRVHTSTVTVAVIPKPDSLDLNIRDKDLKIETKRASGAGGQHVNTTDSAIRIVHLPSGLAVECQTERSLIKNKEIALKRLQAKLCQQHFESETATQNATRKSQVGSSLRNEKIRTYNYNQDRVTDHRLTDGGTLHNLSGFMAGGPELDELIQKLDNSQRKQEILEKIKSIK